MVRLERTAEGWRITDGAAEVQVPPEKFEDLYYAVPTHPTQFFRLLTDDVCATEADRHALRKMLDAEGLTAALESLMRQIRESPAPGGSAA